MRTPDSGATTEGEGEGVCCHHIVDRCVRTYRHRGKADAGMGMARYVVDAVLLKGTSAREVARAHGISKTWIYELIRRYRAGGYDALAQRSRRPHSCKHETSSELVKAIVAPRTELQARSRRRRR